jgi:hypothetical protein
VRRKTGHEEEIMDPVPKKPESIADDEDFIRFLQVAREEPPVLRQLTTILSQDDFNRQSLLNTWISDLELQGAPVELKRALTYLLDADVAATALQLLQD